MLFPLKYPMMLEITTLGGLSASLCRWFGHTSACIILIYFELYSVLGFSPASLLFSALGCEHDVEQCIQVEHIGHRLLWSSAVRGLVELSQLFLFQQRCDSVLYPLRSRLCGKLFVSFISSLSFCYFSQLPDSKLVLQQNEFLFFSIGIPLLLNCAPGTWFSVIKTTR